MIYKAMNTKQFFLQKAYGNPTNTSWSDAADFVSRYDSHLINEEDVPKLVQLFKEEAERINKAHPRARKLSASGPSRYSNSISFDQKDGGASCYAYVRLCEVVGYLSE